jgi:hypothetical protein
MDLFQNSLNEVNNWVSKEKEGLLIMGKLSSKRSTQKLDEEYTEKLDKLNGLHMNRRIKS